MKLRCIKTEGRDYLTVGRIYHAYFTEWRDLFTEADDSYNEKGEYKQLPEDKRWGHGPATTCFEFVDGTPEEKALWDYCEENGIDGL